jgi:hypothetical protein
MSLADFKLETGKLKTGANPTTSSYNASVVKIYSATNSMARFYNKKYFSLM